MMHTTILDVARTIMAVVRSYSSAFTLGAARASWVLESSPSQKSADEYPLFFLAAHNAIAHYTII